MLLGLFGLLRLLGLFGLLRLVGLLGLFGLFGLLVWVELEGYTNLVLDYSRLRRMEFSLSLVWSSGV